LIEVIEAKRVVQRQRVAWAVIGLALLCFGLGLIATTWETTSFYRSASVSETARLQVYGGTVLVRSARSTSWTGAAPDSLLSAGDSIKTDPTAQALLRLFDGSTIRLFGAAEVRIDELSQRRFVAGPDVLRLSILRGQVHIGVAPVSHRLRDLAVVTANGLAHLEDGSYGLRMDNGLLELKVQQRGQATVSNGNEKAVVPQDHRIEVPPIGALLPVEPALTELLFNGLFDQGLLGWDTGNEIGFPEGQDILGQVRLESDGNELAVRFSRQGSHDSHVETYIEQPLRANVSDFSELRLKGRYRIVSHKLGGGGYDGSEYPMLVRVDYNYGGGDTFRVFGFYTQNERRNRTDNGLQVTANEGHDFDIDLRALDPRPVMITRVRISASGWDFDSYVGEVSLSGL
jgi:hypothetical protein